MFRGRSELAIDEKGRIMLPVKYREYLSKQDEHTLVLTNLDDCLVAFPTGAWAAIEQKILNRAAGTSIERNFRRFLLNGVQECPLDRQGRILVPQSLREYAHLEREVVIGGLIDHFEIWSADRYHRAIEQSQQGQQERPADEPDEIRSFRQDVGL